MQQHRPAGPKAMQQQCPAGPQAMQVQHPAGTQLHNSLKEFGVLGFSSVLMSLKRLSAHKECPGGLLPLRSIPSQKQIRNSHKGRLQLWVKVVKAH
jgi:hypothetical protein